MAISGVQLLAASIVNAVTFELLVDIPITFVVNNSGPWATGVGFLGTLFFLMACVVYAFPDIVCKMTRKRLLEALSTLLRYLLPWIGLKLLWAPGNYLLCRLTMKLFSKRCHRLKFINIAQFVFGGICLYSALHRTGLTRDFEDWLICCWRRSLIYRLYSGCCGRPAGTDGSIAVHVQVQDTPTGKRTRRTSKCKESSPRRSRKRSTPTRRGNSGSRGGSCGRRRR